MKVLADFLNPPWIFVSQLKVLLGVVQCLPLQYPWFFLQEGDHSILEGYNFHSQFDLREHGSPLGCCGPRSEQSLLHPSSNSLQQQTVTILFIKLGQWLEKDNWGLSWSYIALQSPQILAWPVTSLLVDFPRICLFAKCSRTILQSQPHPLPASRNSNLPYRPVLLPCGSKGQFFRS